MKISVCLLTSPRHHVHKLFFTVRLIELGLRRNGYDVRVVQDRIEFGRTNVLVGYHHLGIEAADHIARSGADYIVAQTEVFDPEGAWSADYRSRFKAVAYALWDRCKGWWEMVSERNSANLGLSQTHLLRGGWDDGLRECDPLTWSDRDIDYVFYGTMSPHREAYIDSIRLPDNISGREPVVFSFSDILHPVRRSILERSRVCLAPVWSEKSRCFSWQRCLHALINGMGVVAEPADDMWLFGPYHGRAGWAELDYRRQVDYARSLPSNEKRFRGIV